MQQKNTKVHRAKLDFGSASRSSKAWSHVRHADQWDCGGAVAQLRYTRTLPQLDRDQLYCIQPIASP
jgi:hypothetical protein